MHVILFGLKRAWQSSLRITRPALAAVGLTAARFDLLYALHDPGPWPIGETQCNLRRKLGVSRTTTSRMLRSLEELGLVTRKRYGGDRRTLSVSLTAEGLRRIRVAIKRLIRSGAAQLVVDTALARKRWHDDAACFWQTDALDRFLGGIRETFRDFATLYYPWHPDD